MEVNVDMCRHFDMCTAPWRLASAKMAYVGGLRFSRGPVEPCSVAGEIIVALE